MLIASACVLGAQPPAERAFKIIKLDPALDGIISPDAKLETFGDHFGLTEGPVWVQHGGDGYLLFSDNAGNEIYKWSPRAPLSVFLQKSGYTGNNVDERRRANADGRRRCDSADRIERADARSQGRLLITAMTDRKIVRLEKDGTRTLLADRYQGKRFNGPNDIVCKSDGAIYFTDTIWGMRGADKSPDRELPYQRILSDQGWQGDAARRRERQRNTQRHRAVAR